MAVFIESRFNDGYIAHHASDIIMVSIVHRPEDGYLLSYDKEVITERLRLEEFIQRLHSSEQTAQKFTITGEVRQIENALRERKIHEISEWLDHRYSSLIKTRKLRLVQHSHSVNIRHVNLPHEYSQPMTTDEAWNPDQVKKKQEEMGLVPKSVRDEEIYYAMIK